MELKDYQQRVITDLNDYLTVLENTQLLDVAFKNYWAEKNVPDITPYKNNVANVPHVCIKVPTAGGKTFIAVNAIKTIFECFARTNPKQAQFVVWLVPSLTILEQTVKALANPDHPYRKQLNIDFRHRVAVYQKHDLLMAADFSLDTAQEQLSIVVMSFDSLRAKNKEDRKIYQDNGYLASFLTADNNHQDWLLDGYDASALINVMRRLKPVIVVDESHNAETALSVEMLKNLNPNFILGLTATPKNNSNIISYVDAMQLKKQHMVKLPVIVSNHHDKHKVIEEALILRQQLENIAIQQQNEGGKYIRPIILFQAQAKTADDNTTFEKIKEFLISVSVPAEQIKIKTAQINELKNIDLLSPDCPVRYIITVNALKEGWDCPFAYILASLADKSSSVDVEQILGRVLRMPHVQQHGHDLLNMSYVLTASSRFLDTLQSIIKALNKAGFSDKDYRQALSVVENLVVEKPQQPAFSFDVLEQAIDIIDDLDSQKIADWQNITIPVHPELVEGQEHGSTGSPSTVNNINTAMASVKQLMTQAISQNEQYQEIANHHSDSYLPAELEAKVNKYTLKDIFRDEMLCLKLPQFVMPTPNSGFLSSEMQLVERDWLLKDFKLANLDAEINFEHIDTEMYQVDLEQVGNNDYAPKPFKMDYAVREKFNKYILSLDKSGQIFNLTARLFQLIGNLYPIDDNDAKTYIGRIVAQMSAEQINDCLERDMAYVRKIKQKINALQDAHAYKTFTNWLDVEKITVEPMFSLPPVISPKGKAPDIAKSLYLTEDSINNFEHRIINDIAQLDNIVWWHRNLSKGKGFCINGAFVNHYPDFIVKTKAGRMLIIETKGDDRDNSDSANKLKLGKEWANKAGSQYRYLMIFDNKPIEGAERLQDALSKIGQL